jgi:hypothetical protein
MQPIPGIDIVAGSMDILKQDTEGFSWSDSTETYHGYIWQRLVHDLPPARPFLLLSFVSFPQRSLLLWQLFS